MGSGHDRDLAQICTLCAAVVVTVGCDSAPSVDFPLTPPTGAKLRRVGRRSPVRLSILLVFIAAWIARVVGPEHGAFAWGLFIAFWACFAILLSLVISDLVKRRRASR